MDKIQASQVVLVVKNPPANAGKDAGDMALIPGSGISPGEGNGNTLQYSCLENPMNRGAWWVTVHGVTKSYLLSVLVIPDHSFPHINPEK